MTTTDIKHDLIERFDRKLKQKIGDAKKQITEGSYERYNYDLRWYDKYLIQTNQSVLSVGPAESEAVLSSLAETYNGTSGSNRWQTISRLYDYLSKLDLIEENPCDPWDPDDVGMGNDAKKKQYIDDKSNKNVEAPSDDEVNQMVENVRSKQNRLRDQLIIKLLYHTGCRIDEFRYIRIDDIDRENREITLRKSTTKNGEARIVRYGESAVDLMREWLDNGYRDRLKHHQSPYLIITQQSDQISKSALTNTVKSAAKNAGINEPLYEDAAGHTRWKITAHNLRHACATTMIDEGADIYHVSKYLGHSSVKITEKIYVHEGDRLGVDQAHEFGPQ